MTGITVNASNNVSVTTRILPLVSWGVTDMVTGHEKNQGCGGFEVFTEYMRP